MSNVSELLISFTKLIEKPEIKAFQFSLIQTLSKIIVADSLYLYEVRTLKHVSTEAPDVFLVRAGFEEHMEEDLPEPMLLSTQPQFVTAFETQEITVQPVTINKKKRYCSIFPILDAKGVTGFLEVNSKKIVHKNQDLVSIFIEFYRNYLALLNDNQRDHLSGLLNRKSFDDQMMQIIISLGESNKRQIDKVQYCLALFDIDHFKRVNDNFGHLVGDEVLLHFSQCMNETFREYDLLFRVGGEEFVAVLRNVNREVAEMIMERFRQVVENHHFPQVGRVTVSIGSTFIVPSDLSVTIMDRADKALYYAKENGRNRVIFYEQLIADGKIQESKTDSEFDMF